MDDTSLAKCDSQDPWLLAAQGHVVEIGDQYVDRGSDLIDASLHGDGEVVPPTGDAIDHDQKVDVARRIVVPASDRPEQHDLYGVKECDDLDDRERHPCRERQSSPRRLVVGS